MIHYSVDRLEVDFTQMLNKLGSGNTVLPMAALRGAAIAFGKLGAQDLLEPYLEEEGTDAACLRAFVASMRAQGVKNGSDKLEGILKESIET
jgi:hypothetical protein